MKSGKTNLPERACFEHHAGGRLWPSPVPAYAALSILLMPTLSGPARAQSSVTPPGNAPGSPAGAAQGDLP